MLGKAVHSLSRIGDELYLEPLEDGVRGWVGLQQGAGFASHQARCPWADLSAEFVPPSPHPVVAASVRALSSSLVPEVPGGGWGVTRGKGGVCRPLAVGAVPPGTQGRLRGEGIR